MAITQKEKDQLRTILGKIEGMELVRLGGMVYDSVLKAGLSTPKLLVLGKFIYANVPWAGLPKEINDVRLALVKSAEENILGKLADVFDIAPETEAVEVKGEETSATPAVAAPPPATLPEEPAKDDPTTHMESVPGGDTELPPTTAADLLAVSDGAETATQLKADEQREEEDPLGDVEDDAEDAEIEEEIEQAAEQAAEAAEQKLNPPEPTPPPPVETPANGKPAETTP